MQKIQPLKKTGHFNPSQLDKICKEHVTKLLEDFIEVYDSANSMLEAIAFGVLAHELADYMTARNIISNDQKDKVGSMLTEYA